MKKIKTTAQVIHAKRIFILTILISPVFLNAQKKQKTPAVPDSLITKSGWVIHGGDTLTLGLGSLPNGAFKYITDISLSSALSNSYSSNYYSDKYNEEKNAFNKNNAGLKIVVKDLDKSNVYFKWVGRKKIFVEPAILSGELEVPKQYKNDKSSPSTADELIKLKKLLDDGVLTKDEFDAEKKKILDKK